ncbi:MAG: trypsin-like peptidase domain-containing protein [Bacteriovoracaceae bacterium]|nr:trypsin-like peptidase domain-containing protein [Bacteriovoracaceae bacterium]
MYKLIALLIFASTCLNAQEIRLLKSEKDVIKLRMKAGLRITELKNKKKINLGSGFFVGDEGYFLTNHHVVKNALSDKKVLLEVQTRNGKRLSDIRMIKCSDERKIDLCIFRVNGFKPKSYFVLNENSISIGQRNILIGHCHLFPWKIKSGKTLKVWKDIESKIGLSKLGTGSPVEMVEGSFKPCPGDSGAALFSSNKGILLGMITEGYKTSSKTYQVAISNKELFKYYKKYHKELGESVTNLKTGGAQGKREIFDKVFGE